MEGEMESSWRRVRRTAEMALRMGWRNFHLTGQTLPMEELSKRPRGQPRPAPSLSLVHLCLDLLEVSSLSP